MAQQPHPPPQPYFPLQHTSGGGGGGGGGGGAGGGGSDTASIAAQAAADGDGDDDDDDDGEPSRPLTAQEKAQRRKEKAREYSRVARRRQEQYVNELRERVEMLGVYHYLVEECGPDLVLCLSADVRARVLFANGLAGRALGVDPGALIGQCVLAVCGLVGQRAVDLADGIGLLTVKSY
jgi:hypothetical protein